MQSPQNPNRVTKKNLETQKTTGKTVRKEMRGDPEPGSSRPSGVAFPTHRGAPSVQLCFFAKVDVAANIAVFG